MGVCCCGRRNVPQCWHQAQHEAAAAAFSHHSLLSYCQRLCALCGQVRCGSQHCTSIAPHTTQQQHKCACCGSSRLATTTTANATCKVMAAAALILGSVAAYAHVQCVVHNTHRYGHDCIKKPRLRTPAAPRQRPPCTTNPPNTAAQPGYLRYCLVTVTPCLLTAPHPTATCHILHPQ